MLKKTELNNVGLPTLLIAVNNIEHYCWAWNGCNNAEQQCTLTTTKNAGTKTLFNTILADLTARKRLELASEYKSILLFLIAFIVYFPRWNLVIVFSKEKYKFARNLEIK